MSGELCKKVFSIIFLILVLFSSTACDKKQKDPIIDKAASYKFAIYYKSFDSAPNSPEDRKISEKPLITEHDIKNYYWTSHKIEFTDEFLKNHNFDIDNDFELFSTSDKLGISDLDTALIVVKGKLIYEAGFPLKPYRSSYSGDEIVLEVAPKSNMLHIALNDPSQSRDLRKDDRIYNALKEAGVLVEK